MTTRIVIPVEDQKGLESQLAEHFGHAPYYAIVELDENKQVSNIHTELNKSEHVGGTGLPHEQLLLLKPNVFVVRGMGPGCLASIRSYGINVLQANGNTVKEIVDFYIAGNLIQLVGGCAHHGHGHSHNC